VVQLEWMSHCLCEDRRFKSGQGCTRSIGVVVTYQIVSLVPRFRLSHRPPKIFRVVGQLVGRLFWEEDIVSVRVRSTLLKGIMTVIILANINVGQKLISEGRGVRIISGRLDRSARGFESHSSDRTFFAVIAQ
jgi:hypothetical protein